MQSWGKSQSVTCGLPDRGYGTDSLVLTANLKNLTMILDIWNSHICTAVKRRI